MKHEPKLKAEAGEVTGEEEADLLVVVLVGEVFYSLLKMRGEKES